MAFLLKLFIEILKLKNGTESFRLPEPKVCRTRGAQLFPWPEQLCWGIGCSSAARKNACICARVCFLNIASKTFSEDSCPCTLKLKAARVSCSSLFCRPELPGTFCTSSHPVWNQEDQFVWSTALNSKAALFPQILLPGETVRTGRDGGVFCPGTWAMLMGGAGCLAPGQAPGCHTMSTLAYFRACCPWCSGKIGDRIIKSQYN